MANDQVLSESQAENLRQQYTEVLPMVALLS